MEGESKPVHDNVEKILRKAERTRRAFFILVAFTSILTTSVVIVAAQRAKTETTNGSYESATLHPEARRGYYAQRAADNLVLGLISMFSGFLAFRVRRKATHWMTMYYQALADSEEKSREFLKRCRASKKPFAIFLRCFADEYWKARAVRVPLLESGSTKNLQKPRWVEYLIRNELQARSIEMFCISNVNDPLVLPGANRIRASSERWLDEIVELASDAHLVVVYASIHSDGILAELAMLREMGFENKTVGIVGSLLHRGGLSPFVDFPHTITAPFLRVIPSVRRKFEISLSECLDRAVTRSAGAGEPSPRKKNLLGKLMSNRRGWRMFNVSWFTKIGIALALAVLVFSKGFMSEEGRNLKPPQLGKPSQAQVSYFIEWLESAVETDMQSLDALVSWDAVVAHALEGESLEPSEIYYFVEGVRGAGGLGHLLSEVVGSADAELFLLESADGIDGWWVTARISGEGFDHIRMRLNTDLHLGFARVTEIQSLRLGDFGAMVRFLRDDLATGGSHYSMVLSQIGTGNLEDAHSGIDYLLSIYPGEFQLHLLKAHVAAQLEDYALYHAAVNEIRELFSETGPGSLFLMNHYLMNEQHELCLSRLDQLPLYTVDDPYFDYLRALVLFLQGKPKESIESARLALEDDEDLLGAYEVLFKSNQSMGNTEEAEQVRRYVVEKFGVELSETN